MVGGKKESGGCVFLNEILHTKGRHTALQLHIVESEPAIWEIRVDYPI